MSIKLLTSLIIVSVIPTAYAMPCDVSCHEGIFEVALTGGGFKTTTDNTAYGINASSFVAAPEENLVSIGNGLKNSPKFKFEGTVLLGYYFQNSTINVDASYTGMRNQLNDSATGMITPELIPPAIFGDDLNSVSAASSNYNFDYDYVNIEVGSLTQLCRNGLTINPQVGLSYAHLKNNQLVGYAGGGLTTHPFSVERTSTFDGIGASFAMDVNYCVYQPLSLIGNFRYNALIGNVNASYSLTGFEPDAGRPQRALSMSIALSSKNTLVSLFQTELGLGYDFNFSKMFCGNFAVGYQLTKSIGNAEQMQFVDDRTQSSFVDSLLNTNLHGYFARLTMDFSV
jgi:hypothetical protein